MSRIRFSIILAFFLFLSASIASALTVSRPDGSVPIAVTLAPVKINLLQPNGGEIIPAGGKAYTIMWEAPVAATKFKLKYSMDGGATWRMVAPDFLTGESYDWQVPIPSKNKKKCLVKVIGYNDTNVKVGADLSDAPFTIEVARLTSPNGGELLTSGNQHTVTWTTNGIALEAMVVLSYTMNNGVTWKAINTAADTSNDGSFLWTVPNVSKSKNKCKVKVVFKDNFGNVLGSDVSDSVFTINPSPIVGSWYGSHDDHEYVLTFMSDGKYFHAESGTATATGYSGMERGTYTWDATSGAFTVITIVNTNGDWGLSDASGGPPITVMVNDNTLVAEGTSLTRVGQ